MVKFFIITLFFLLSCATPKQQTSPSLPNQVPVESFEVTQIKEARKLYQQKDYSGADRILELINDTAINDEEKIDKYNLWGLALYSLNDFANSSKKFQKAKSLDIKDKTLDSQITLNISTCYYKMMQTKLSWENLKLVNFEILPDNDKSKYYTLYHWLAESQQLISENLFALIHLCQETQDEKELLKKECGLKIQSIIENKDPDEQLSLLDKMTVPDNYAAYYWGQRIQLKLKRKMMNGAADKVGHWLNAYTSQSRSGKNNSNRKDLGLEVDDLILLGKMGVVLPLSGERAEISQKFLQGIKQAIKQLKAPVELVIKDSSNPKNLEALYTELATKDQVGMVIGGAFPSTSEQEYNLASQLKMVFFSLAPVSSSTEIKNFDLFEISGSIQSQNHALFNEDVATTLGKKFVLIYSGDNSGATIADAVWKESQEKKFTLENVSTYSRGMTDYRDSVLELLGLKYSRERLEEYNLWYRLYYYKTKNDLSRIQVLKPKTDFDWVYLPSTPSEAMQIISSFIYAEAKNLTYVGGPQWRSAQLIRTATQWSSKVYFLDSSRTGDWVKDNGENILESLGSIPEYLGFESFVTAHAFYQRLSSSSSRQHWLNELDDMDEMDKAIGVWKKEQKYWVKEMKLFAIQKDGRVIAL
ncbi:MAG: ABC transporter substrate-binding protein [Bacteriovoracaceae bacterium]|nr:ABC transporter substrate-binding protein [Bacteriovoracaceae bacterium]